MQKSGELEARQSLHQTGHHSQPRSMFLKRMTFFKFVVLEIWMGSVLVRTATSEQKVAFQAQKHSEPGEPEEAEVYS